MQRILILGTALLMTTACGKSEGEIRAEERLKYAEERLAEEKARNDSLANSTDEAETKPEAEVVRDAPVRETSASTVRANERRIGSYRAFIGRDDLYNSSGKRLDQPWQILRQDRANFHRFGVSQRGDTSDEFFASGRNREIMERLVRSGSISPVAKNRLVRGGAVVFVEIYGEGDTGNRVVVTVD
ncbi:hypothetical protein [Pontixanthobacter aquaemixtae]|uniref:hypothetical protein n=1 Tax=Pontixanthobacter aquaemixtae TaxID=1958940 RepID=UPI001925E7E5|nr:hypothetical protein [Pontixanthobacter aquaemixtae]